MLQDDAVVLGNNQGWWSQTYVGNDQSAKSVALHMSQWSTHYEQQFELFARPEIFHVEK